MPMRSALLALILLCLVSASIAQHGTKLFNASVIHEIKLYSNDPNLWEDLLTHYNNSQNGGENIYNPVDIKIDGTSMSAVGLRIKGFSSAWGTSGKKKPFRIDFNEFVAGQSYDGIKKISLNNAWADASCMRDVIAYNILRYEGVAASRTSYAKLYINDEYWGLYIIAEQVDKTFLEENFNNDNGNLYKCIGWSNLGYLGASKEDYKGTFELKTNETNDDWTGFLEFVKYLNMVDITQEQYKTNFPQKFDIPTFFKVLAVDVLLRNWDSYYDHGRNYYIYDNPETKKMTWIPWDYNLAFSSTPIDILAENNVLGQGPKPLIRNLLKDPEMVKLLVKTYQDILSENFTPARLEPLIMQNKELIREDLSQDPNYNMSMQAFDASLEETQVIHHNDTVGFSYDMDHVFIVTDWNNIPDSVLQSGKMLIDTTQAIYTRFDTLNFDGVEKVFLYMKNVFIYDEMVIGLKGFIRERIAQVKDEIAKLGFVTDIEPLTAADELTVFPNPARSVINLSGKVTTSPFSVIVYDAAGKQLQRYERENKIDVTDLSPGLYFLVVESSVGKVTRKIIRADVDALGLVSH
jgi:spore coat protein CotH